MNFWCEKLMKTEPQIIKIRGENYYFIGGGGNESYDIPVTICCKEKENIFLKIYDKNFRSYFLNK